MADFPSRISYFLPPIAAGLIWLICSILFCFGIFLKVENAFLPLVLISDILYWLSKLGQWGVHVYKNVQRRTEVLNMAPFSNIQNEPYILSPICDLTCFIASIFILILIKSQIEKLIVSINNPFPSMRLILQVLYSIFMIRSFLAGAVSFLITHSLLSRATISIRSLLGIFQQSTNTSISELPLTNRSFQGQLEKLLE